MYKAHVQVSQFFQGCNILLVAFPVKNIVSFCVKKLLHFALKSCYILRPKLLHFGLMLHFASKVVTFRVNVTFCVNCYILQRNIRPLQVLSKLCFRKHFSILLESVREHAWLTDLKTSASTNDTNISKTPPPA